MSSGIVSDAINLSFLLLCIASDILRLILGGGGFRHISREDFGNNSNKSDVFRGTSFRI